ncbi:hypothetical protein BM221_003668 [Beauveria bassiana]|uniref:Uncharacterized protein n=1 Tax=Beauveria bassiana TaxID=176275 RepID=A0A2N6NVB5_BEABA|nr:hypothetical protein BM221_003668 [Beauveria bassiana]
MSKLRAPMPVLAHDDDDDDDDDDEEEEQEEEQEEQEEQDVSPIPFPGPERDRLSHLYIPRITKLKQLCVCSVCKYIPYFLSVCITGLKKMI